MHGTGQVNPPENQEEVNPPSEQTTEEPNSPNVEKPDEVNPTKQEVSNPVTGNLEEVTPPKTESTPRPNYTNSNAEEKSDNANLGVMDIEIGYLSPEFNKNTTSYDLIVDLTVDNININAVPEDPKASVSIRGNTDLQIGENTIYIVVTAEAKNTKTYTINVIKTDYIELLNAKLKTLSVKNFNIYPSFKPNIYNYNLTITEKIEDLEIVAETENENAKIEITGNTDLQEGENVVKVIVTAEDGVTKREYKINIFISSKEINVQKQDIKEPIIILTFLALTVLGVVIALIKKR